MVYHAVIACSFCLHLIHVWTYTIKASWHQISYFCGLSLAALFLVMSKAFDKVPHHHLLCSLSVISISGPLLKWFESYISNHSQKLYSMATPQHHSRCPIIPFWDPCYSSLTLTPCTSPLGLPSSSMQKTSNCTDLSEQAKIPSS